MHLKRSTALRYAIATILGAALHAEWLIYRTRYLFWNEFDCLNDELCTKILFIADPQITGNSDYPTPLNYLINWDSDRYLKLTFRAVVEYFKPDVVVFLGDLMNDGATASQAKFQGYIKRLTDVFQLDYGALKIWVPGDSDVVGSGIHREHLKELDRVLKQRHSVVRFRNITFYKVNVMTNTFPEKTDIDNSFKIIVSHFPVLERRDLSLKIENLIHPNIYFCGHTHESKYMIQMPDGSGREFIMYYHPRTSLYLGIEENIQYEIYVPTCSYMLSSSYVGYGAAILDEDHTVMRYEVFWSPERLPFVILYVLILVFLIVYFLVYCKGRFYKQSGKSTLGLKSLPHKM